MKINITIPDEQIPQLKELALVASREEGRTISVTTLCAQYVLAALASELDVSAMADEPPAPPRLSQREADAAKLPPVAAPSPVARSTFGSLGGADEDELEILRRTLADTQRRRAASGLDPATGVPVEALATRAAVQGTGPRPMGFVLEQARGRQLNPGRAPEAPVVKVEPGKH